MNARVCGIDPISCHTYVPGHLQTAKYLTHRVQRHSPVTQSPGRFEYDAPPVFGLAYQPTPPRAIFVKGFPDRGGDVSKHYNGFNVYLDHLVYHIETLVCTDKPT